MEEQNQNLMSRTHELGLIVCNMLYFWSSAIVLIKQNKANISYINFVMKIKSIFWGTKQDRESAGANFSVPDILGVLQVPCYYMNQHSTACTEKPVWWNRNSMHCSSTARLKFASECYLPLSHSQTFHELMCVKWKSLVCGLSTPVFGK